MTDAYFKNLATIFIFFNFRNEKPVQLDEDDIPKLKTFDQGMFDE